MLYNRFFYLCLAGCVSACGMPRPEILDGTSNQTGAAIAVTPSTYGVTSITTGRNQAACTEPRPNASFDSKVDGEGEVKNPTNDDESFARLEALITRTVGASKEFQSVEFLAHGLFGICQLAAAGSITPEQADKLIGNLIDKAATLSTPGQQ